MDIKELFKSKPKEVVVVNSNTNDSTQTLQDSQQSNTTTIRVFDYYNNKGFTEAGLVNGNIHTLENHLDSVCTDIKNRQANDKEHQEKHKANLRIDIAKCQAEKGKLEKDKEISQGKISNLKQQKDTKIKIRQEEIEKIKNEIHDIKSNPDKYIKDKTARVSFYIGIVLLIAISIYLILFYASASWSAFFREIDIEEEIQLTNALFDPLAYTHAYEKGLPSLLLITLIPFVFLGLGYLIHVFQEHKERVKAIFTIIITFIYDAFLAYEITEKLYTAKVMGSFGDKENYGIRMALSSPNFWIIIFSGFLVYIIWGFILDFTLKYYEKLDTIKVKITALQNKKAGINQEISDISKDTDDNVQKIQTEINDIDSKIAEVDSEIKVLQAQLQNVFFNITNILKELSSYFAGWTRYVTAAGRKHEVPQHTSIYNKFLQNNGLNNNTTINTNTTN